MNKYRGVADFFIVSCAASWTIAAILVVLGNPHPAVTTILMVVYMFGPAVGAWVAARRSGTTFRSLVTFRPNRFWLVAWLAPFLLSALTVAAGALLPGVEWSPDMTGFFERMASSLPASELERMKTEMRAMPRWALPLIVVVQPLVAGISVNALAAFGEEVGWRGWLHHRLRDRGFWSRSLVIGFLWGVWHAPIIARGHNYPEHPAIGVAMMIAFCILLAPFMEWVRERGGSVWAAHICHGTVNATAGASLLLLRGGSDLTVGVTGVSGFAVLALGNVSLWIFLRRRRP